MHIWNERMSLMFNFFDKFTNIKISPEVTLREKKHEILLTHKNVIDSYVRDLFPTHLSIVDLYYSKKKCTDRAQFQQI